MQKPRIGLAGGAATVKGGVDVVAPFQGGHPQRFEYPEALGHRREVVLETLPVENDAAGSVVQTDSGDRLFAATGCLDEWDWH